MPITFDIPPAELERFHFEPGQFLTVKAVVDGQEVRRSCSHQQPAGRLARRASWKSASRPVEGGVFSNWAAQSRQGRRHPQRDAAGRPFRRQKATRHPPGRFAAGSGITPILSIAATTLEEQPESSSPAVQQPPHVLGDVQRSPAGS